MDWFNSLEKIFTSSNTASILLVVVALVLVLAFLAKKGIVSFSGFGLKVDNGADEREIERAILRSQMAFIRTEINDFYSKVPQWEGRDEWKVKYILEKCQDIFYEVVSINHITLESVYVDLKCRGCWGEIVQNVDNPNIINEDFKKVVYEETKYILTKLLEIREYYKKENKCV